MSLAIDLLLPEVQENIPDKQQFMHWAALSLHEAGHDQDAEISLTLVSQEEMIALNHEYRHKKAPTNVLSFPADLPEVINLPLLGDIVFCQDIIEQEALEQKKPLEAHWAHMTIHGVLHLLGYDHIDADEAQVMENIEIQILNQLGYNNPYYIKDH